MELALGLLDVGEQAVLALAHAFFSGDLEQPRIEFPLLEDGGLLGLAEIPAGNDVGGMLEHAAGAGQRLLLVFAGEHGGSLRWVSPVNGRATAKVPRAYFLSLSLFFCSPVLAASLSIRPRRSLGSGSPAISSYMACSCFCTHMSNGRSVDAFARGRGISPPRPLRGLSSLAMPYFPGNEGHSSGSRLSH